MEAESTRWLRHVQGRLKTYIFECWSSPTTRRGDHPRFCRPRSLLPCSLLSLSSSPFYHPHHFVSLFVTFSEWYCSLYVLCDPTNL